jgi:osmotically-inducible protein OsmY
MTRFWKGRPRRRGLEDLQQRLEDAVSGLSWFAGGAALGTAVMYLADPQTGSRRRALVRDRTVGSVRRLVRRGGRVTRIAGAYTVSRSRRVRHLREQPKEFDDATLAQKVQSEVFRDADSPKGTVDVNVANGVVQLRGEVERPELIDDLVAKVRKVQGVREVESLLHVPHTAPTYS